jgi:hypothetical protein
MNYRFGNERFSLLVLRSKVVNARLLSCARVISTRTYVGGGHLRVHADFRSPKLDPDCTESHQLSEALIGPGLLNRSRKSLVWAGLAYRKQASI